MSPTRRCGSCGPGRRPRRRSCYAGAETVRPLGTRHSFSLVGDSAGALLSTEHLDRVVEIGEETVTVEAGVRYGDLEQRAGSPRPRVAEPGIAATHLGRRCDRHRHARLRSREPFVGRRGCIARARPRGRVDQPAPSRRRRLRRRRREPRSTRPRDPRVARRRSGVRAPPVRLRAASVVDASKPTWTRSSRAPTASACSRCGTSRRSARSG